MKFNDIKVSNFVIVVSTVHLDEVIENIKFIRANTLIIFKTI